MGKVEITLQSSLVTKHPRKDREPTVFRRSILKLSENKLHPGKVIRVYVHIDDDYKVFGVFTINTGGSISFFPDFYNLDNFDHLTLSKDFIKNKGHLTKIKPNGKHKKAYHFEANKLLTGGYHLITFAMNDGDLLMDSLPEVNYPDIEFDNENETEFLTLLEDALCHAPMMLSFPEEDGFYCIQILVLPKEKSINDVGVFLELKSIFTLKNPIDKTINTKAIEIKTPQDFDFSLYIVCFKIQQDLESPFVFAMAQDPKKPPFAPVHKKKTNK
ncbi:MAG: hypothetical protein ACK5RE_08920 [Pseudanabaena sp.]|jgi:hypothetical protein